MEETSSFFLIYSPSRKLGAPGRLCPLIPPNISNWKVRNAVLDAMGLTVPLILKDTLEFKALDTCLP